MNDGITLFELWCAHTHKIHNQRILLNRRVRDNENGNQRDVKRKWKKEKPLTHLLITLKEKKKKSHELVIHMCICDSLHTSHYHSAFDWAIERR